MTDAFISNGQTRRLSSISADSRCVLYEEFAEYHYRFIRKNALQYSNIQTEIRYHLCNIVLLSLYFDHIIIQTASLFNSTDKFVRSVATGVLSHGKFREMVACNVVKIVGWGATDPKDIFDAAAEFAVSANQASYDAEYFALISRYFDDNSLLSRSEIIPDADTVDWFQRRLSQSTIIRNPSELSLVKDALKKSQEKINQLVAISFIPELGKLALSADAIGSVESSFILSWYDNIGCEIPNTAVYSPLSIASYFDYEFQFKARNIRVFLYSPQIFAAFLRGYISNRDFNRIMDRPFGDLQKIKNGDWSRFASAYHDAIATVSNNIGYFDIIDQDLTKSKDYKKWSEDIKGVIQRDFAHVDVNAFVESIAVLSGIMLTFPLLGPIYKAGGALVGKKLNETFHSIRGNKRSPISPFINKLLKNYELEGSFA